MQFDDDLLDEMGIAKSDSVRTLYVKDRVDSRYTAAHALLLALWHVCAHRLLCVVVCRMGDVRLVCHQHALTPLDLYDFKNDSDTPVLDILPRSSSSLRPYQVRILKHIGSAHDFIGFR